MAGGQDAMNRVPTGGHAMMNVDKK